MSFRAAAVSETGPVREGNEDAAYASGRLLVLADGVGGHAHGEIASATTELVLRRADKPPQGDVLEVLSAVVRQAREALETAAEMESGLGLGDMGTTLIAVLTDGERIGLAHVGDSRAYLLRDGTLQRLTRDHTFVQDLVDAGSISAEQARRHPQRSVVTRALDGHQHAEPDLTAVDADAGDRLLLCSDGVSDYLDDGPIGDLLAEGTVETAASVLVATALDAGSRDNVTALVADLVAEPVDESAVPLLVGASVDPSTLPGWTRD